MRPDDFARFGILFANEGVWAGDRLISADYVQTSLAAQSAFYGLQWWVMNATYFSGNAPPIDVSAAHGLQGQHIYVWRDGNVVLVVLTKYVHDRTQGYVLSFANFPKHLRGAERVPGLGRVRRFPPTTSACYSTSWPNCGDVGMRTRTSAHRQSQPLPENSYATREKSGPAYVFFP